MVKTKTDLSEINFDNISEFCINISKFIPILENRNVRKIFFVNKGWRLTYSGLVVLNEYFKSYTTIHEENQKLTAKIILNIDSCINGPWYVSQKGRVTLYDNLPFFELSMFDGNLNSFVRSLSPDLR